MKQFIIWVLAAAWIVGAASQASAFCIPYWAGTFDECDPSNGEPPSWCNEAGLSGMVKGLIETENKVDAVIALAKAGFKSPTYK